MESNKRVRGVGINLHHEKSCCINFFKMLFALKQCQQSATVRLMCKNNLLDFACSKMSICIDLGTKYCLK